jgi:hypothetical protein
MGKFTAIYRNFLAFTQSKTLDHNLTTVKSVNSVKISKLDKNIGKVHIFLSQ